MRIKIQNMKISILIGLFFLGGLSLSAQCFDYQSEIQSTEDLISAANRNQKKISKVATLEEGQQLVDKSVTQIDLAIKSVTLARENASACNCTEGVNSATNLYNAIFDYRNLSQKAADAGSIEEIKEMIKKNLETGVSIISELSESSSLCME